VILISSPFAGSCKHNDVDLFSIHWWLQALFVRCHLCDIFPTPSTILAALASEEDDIYETMTMMVVTLLMQVFVYCCVTRRSKNIFGAQR
jgi:hypothetical protein